MTDNRAHPHVLAMDHSWEVLDLIHDILEEAGIRVTTRLLLEQTVERIVELQPNLIIMDYMYARDDRDRGLFEELKRDARTASLPIILCTGAVPDTEGIRENLEHLGVRVVYKPFDIDVLLREVQTCLGGV